MPLFGTWLEDTLELQVQSYGNDPARLDLPEWLTYVREQSLASFVELGEFIQNIAWKPWAKSKHLPSSGARDEAVNELVDTLHFTANLLLALDVSDDELNAKYEAKMAVNRARMARGGH